MTTAALKEAVYRANMRLGESGLVFGTFGNVSGADHDAGILAIKPSGVPYEDLSPDAMVIVSLDTGQPVDGALRPSSDTPTHVELYRAWKCGGIAHTHAEAATALASAGLDPHAVPGVLVANHGPFTWGADPHEAVERARVLEWLARMDITGRLVAPGAERPAAFLVDRHFFRKHGAGAYYGQRPKP